MYKYLFFLFFQLMTVSGYSQIEWSRDSTLKGELNVNNYSSSFVGDIEDSVPLLVTAIPYNGMYSNFDKINAPLDFDFEGSLFRFSSQLSQRSNQLDTYDSSNVYFLAPGIYKSNSKNYEYRVVLNAKKVITPWSTIDRFTDIPLNMFKKGFGFIGGYKTTWNNYITVELRKKRTDSVISSATIYWKQIKPIVESIFTTKNLNDFFTLLKRPWDSKNKVSNLPSRLSFVSSEKIIIFYLTANVFNKKAIEYQLLHNNKIFREWGSNDYDNNFILLKELPPGAYTLKIRYSAQRQNVAEYPFEITPQWQQTTWFKIIAGSLLAAFLGFILMLFLNLYQQKKIKILELNKERLYLEFQSLRAQLNPHFIFNALSSIQGLINNNENEKASVYLTSFGSLLRQSLKYNNRDMLPLEVEIRMMETYLQLEQLRFNFKYKINIDKEIYTSSVEIPALLLQPLIENAIKHGISILKAKGEVLIDIDKHNNDLVVSITDNGNGFIISEVKSGHGLRLTNERVNLLNSILQSKHILVSIENSKTGGTKSRIIFENWLNLKQ